LKVSYFFLAHNYNHVNGDVIDEIVKLNYTLTMKIEDLHLPTISRNLWEQLTPHIQYLSHIDKEKVELAFMQMVEAHGQQRRKSGEYYITHPVAATITLADMKLDVDTICACLMHDVPEDTDVTLEQLQKTFNDEVTFLVFGITKLGKIKYQGMDRYSENLRKMFIAMSKDLRVVFIKLADRLHNLQTLESLPPEKAQRIARESLEIYVPIAQRLGMNYFKSAIEDAAFPFAYPDEFATFSQVSGVEIEKRMLTTQELLKKTNSILHDEHITQFSLKGRAKKYFSLYKKYLEKGSIAAIHDLIALRVIVPTIDDCYQVLSILHRHFDPLDGKLKDYISTPKSNGYQSLHTTVQDPELQCIFEFQIRTNEMHQFAEYGVASHWSYKSRNTKDVAQFLEPENLKWVTELVELGKEELSHEEYLKHVKLDVFQDRIFVMTPKGDVIDLPEGATVIDFAFKIHQEVGAHAVMGKINGDKVVKISESLKNGDVVEVMTDKKQSPKKDWLGFVRTRQASKHIRSMLRKEG
jgi:GTP diphosphokinase / guanosine-3',5'-bis(diphosphate) 3'-diphosphatase